MEKFNVYDFIEFTKRNPKSFIRYCEIIIDLYGNIILALPSHQEAVIKYAMEKEHQSRKEVAKSIPISYSPFAWLLDKYGLIAVWYEGYEYGTYKNKKPNRFQRKSLVLLKKYGLIDPEWIEQTNEYEVYLCRKSIGLE